MTASVIIVVKLATFLEIALRVAKTVTDVVNLTIWLETVQHQPVQLNAITAKELVTLPGIVTRRHKLPLLLLMRHILPHQTTKHLFQMWSFTNSAATDTHLPSLCHV